MNTELILLGSNLILAIISVILCIGFYNGNLDWVMVYYGCASDTNKNKVNGKKLMTIASLGFIIIAGILMISIGISLLFMNLYAIVHLARVISAMVLIDIILVTFKPCYDSYIKKEATDWIKKHRNKSKKSKNKKL